MPNVDLSPFDWREVARILQQNVPEFDVWAFGSRVRWTAKAHSDLDLAVITDKPLSLKRWAEIKEAFEESVLPFRIDIVDWSATSDAFRQIIEREKVVVQTATTRQLPFYPLEECLDALIDYRGKTPEKTSFGVPLVTAKVIKGGRIETPTEFIAPHDYEPWMRRGIPAEGDVVMTTEAPLGEVAQLGKGKVALAQSVITLRGKAGFLDNTYLLYLLQSEEVQDQLKARATGTTVLGIKQSELRKISVRIPPLSVQLSVVSILKPLDDRITLLRETNATLEAIAQALFKSWFVDFDPVRARQQGLAPEGMDEATAALFPDGFEESELGLVPKGWATGTLASLLRLHKGSVNPGAHPNTDFQHFSLPAFDAGQLPALEPGSAIKSNKTTVPADAVLLSKLPPHIPRVWLPSSVAKHAVCSTEFLPLVPIGPSTTAFVYCLLAAPDFSASLCQLVTGTSNSHQRVKPDGVLSLPAIVPTAPVVTAFDAVASGLLSRVKANRHQAQTLSTLRDTLLPRLISGQLPQPEAQAELEGARP